MSENPNKEAQEPEKPVTDEDVEGHGIEEDGGSEEAEGMTLTGVCVMDVDT